MDGFMREFRQSKGICKFYVVLLYLIRYLTVALVVSEMCRWSGVPGSLVGDTFRALWREYLVLGMFIFGMDRLILVAIRSNNFEGID